MYDTISKQFFGNSGSDSFTGGSVISKKIITDGNHKTFIGTQGCVDMGTLNWNKYTGGNDNTYSCTINDKYKAQKTMSCSKEYTVAVGGSANTLNDKEMIGSSTTYSVYIRDNRYTDAASFKAAVSGKYLFYRREDDAEFISPTIIEITDILPSATSYIDKQTGALYKDWEVIWYDGSQDIPQEYISQTGDLTPNQIVAYRLIEPVYKVLPTTPISLNTKGTKTITVEAEVPCYIKAEYLSKDTIAFINSGVEHDIDLVGSVDVTKTNNILEVM